MYRSRGVLKEKHGEGAFEVDKKEVWRPIREIGVCRKEEQWKKDFEMLWRGAQEFLKEWVWKEQEGEKRLFDPNLRTGALWGTAAAVVGSLFA
jgi:hypothetical protein